MAAKKRGVAKRLLNSNKSTSFAVTSEVPNKEKETENVVLVIEEKNTTKESDVRDRSNQADETSSDGGKQLEKLFMFVFCFNLLLFSFSDATNVSDTKNSDSKKISFWNGKKDKDQLEVNGKATYIFLGKSQVSSFKNNKY
jgi:hypothetical protein